MNCRRYIIFLVLILGFLAPAMGGKKKPSGKGKGRKYASLFAVPLDEKTSFHRWKKHMNSTMKNQLCDTSGVLSKCFAVNKKRCRSDVTLLFKQCLTHYKSKKVIRPHALEGMQVAQNLGLCVGNLFQKKHWKRKKKDRACHD